MADDLTGRVFDRLTVLHKSTRIPKKGTMYVCRCSCGVVKDCLDRSLLHNATRSCGCLRKDAYFRRTEDGKNKKGMGAKPKSSLMTDKEYKNLLKHINPRKIICKVA